MKRFNPDEDFLTLGKKIQSATGELDKALDTKSRLMDKVSQARKAHDLSRKQLLGLQRREKLLDDECLEFNKKADKMDKEAVIRKHEVQNVENEVACLQQELELIQMENEELKKEMEHEKSNRDQLVEIISKANREYYVQLHDRDIFRKQARENAKRSETMKQRLQEFRAANADLIKTLQS